MENKEEIWKDVVGYEGVYKVSSLGNVFSYHKGSKKIKVDYPQNRYLQIRLFSPISKKYNNYLVHRLVAIAFIPNPENKPLVRHLNGECKDCNVTNLSWGTHKENENDKRVHGRICNGEKQWLSKLDKDKVLKIRGMYNKKDGITTRYLGIMFGLNQSTVSDIISRNTWKHV